MFYFYSRIDVIMLALMRSEADAGIYATALKVLEVGVRPLGFVAIAAFPLLSKSFISAEDAFRRTAVRLVGVATLAGGVLGWGMFFVAPLGVVPLLGKWFSTATVTVKEVALLGVLMTYIPHFSNTLYRQFPRVIYFEITSSWHLSPDPDREAL